MADEKLLQAMLETFEKSRTESTTTAATHTQNVSTETFHANLDWSAASSTVSFHLYQTL